MRSDSKRWFCDFQDVLYILALWVKGAVTNSGILTACASGVLEKHNAVVTLSTGWGASLKVKDLSNEEYKGQFEFPIWRKSLSKRNEGNSFRPRY